MKLPTESGTTLAKSSPAKATAITTPSWDRARMFLEGIKYANRVSIAGQVLLGLELAQLKKDHGFAGSGRREKAHGELITLKNAESLNRTWDDWCKSELGISKPTADRLIGTGEAAKARLRRLGGEQTLIGILNTPPAKLDDESRRILAEAVTKVTDGATQKALLEELSLVKKHVALRGGDTSEHQKGGKETAGQLAFAFFSPLADILQEFATDRSNPDYEIYLHTLAATHPDQLSAIQRNLEATLEDIRRASKSVRKA